MATSFFVFFSSPAVCGGRLELRALHAAAGSAAAARLELHVFLWQRNR